MIKAIIQQNERSTVEASGAIPELLTDIAVLVNAIYTQFSNADPATAEMFRTGLIGFISDKESNVWKPMAGQTGIIFPKPE